MIKNEKEIKGNNFNITRSAEELRTLSFNDHVCIGCGICESTCPVSAITLEGVANVERNYTGIYFSGHDKIKQNNVLETNKSGKLTRLTIDENKCVLCGMCSGLCPADALTLTINDEPIKNIDAYPSYNAYAEIDDDECIYCERCEAACPRDAITVTRKLPDRSKLVTGEIEVIEEECIHCGVCEEMCPADAIDVVKTIGEESIEIDTDKCVYCLVCKKSCPVNAIKALCRLCSYGEYDLDEADAEITGATIIDQEACIKCGWCAGVCPTNAAKVKKAFVGKLTAYPEKCGTCGACVDVCPCNALSFPTTKGAIRAVQIVANDDYCIKCGACARICPNDAIEVTRTGIDYTATDSQSWIDALEALKN
ncbi:MAG: tungsten-dependent formylmethanofuran dehydrogenase subunit FwdF [Methanobrevibacter wolinii]|uniref:tungsten-dependent formylmethanofuran dehydrogenase subunit FwdF n=1 Tax=Methanobrevibacter wolinii TaxID=190977 RepID=UPI000694D94B|nr:tungsten-dependent formylmethanofuran dehydrogenase subunit FwdF [Methanobrevibacter wolinii]MDD5959730.1 4Fe-4S binding protein [Methanobrevibacter wolinii]